MYLESEAYGLVLIGFAGVALAAAVVLVVLYVKSRNRHLLWFGGQLVFLCLAFHHFFRALTFLPAPGFSMYSEEQSLTIGLAGICWAASMVCALVGVYQLLRKRDVVYQF